MVSPKMVRVEINGMECEAPEGTTILKAAEKIGVRIPRLCYHPDLPPWAACGICVVKVEGSTKMLRACATPIEPGMKITTHDPEIVQVRKSVLQLILSTHPNDCLRCPRNGNCELQRLAADFGIRSVPFEPRVLPQPVDDSTRSIVLNSEKCVKCGRCAIVCQQMQNVWALAFVGRGDGVRLAPTGDIKLAESPCIRCGQCSAHCPVGAIYEYDETDRVWRALQNPDLYCVVQIAPAVRVALGEAFGYEPGTVLTGKIYAALRRLGFRAVFDTTFGADLTIMEEATEFVQRLLHSTGPLPLITSCCPAWTDYMEKYAPDFIENFSTAKSPHAMLAAMAKTYYAERMGLDPAKIYMVSIMPCTAKKFEIIRSREMFDGERPYVNVSLTTRELARMIKECGIDFVELPDEEADSILGYYTGAGVIFGATGGVMEAALRTAHYLITRRELTDVNFTAIRGLDGVKEATVEIGGRTIRVAAAHWMGNIETVLNRVRETRARGEEPAYHFIEVMACRGGCVGGGGQPYGADDDVRRRRASGIYQDDAMREKRCSHQNPYIQQLYAEYLGAPLSERAHKLLHTRYHRRPLYAR